MNKFFYTLEGGEGSGKTTAAKRVVELLQEKGYNAIFTREPGGVSVAETIRNVILDNNIDSKTEVLLFAAARNEHLECVIKPAVKAQTIVICDRFVDSSLVYQGYVGKNGIDEVLEINQFAINNFFPSKTFYFDIDPRIALERIKMEREINRFDLMGEEFHFAIQDGYSIVRQMFKDRFTTIDASMSPEVIAEQIANAILEDL